MVAQCESRPSGIWSVRHIFGLAYYDPPWVPGFALDQIYQRYFSRFRREQTHLLEHLFSNLEGLVAGPDYDGPALLVWSRHDPVFPLRIGKRLDARMAHSKLVVIEEAAHAPNVEQADVKTRQGGASPLEWTLGRHLRRRWHRTGVRPRRVGRHGRILLGMIREGDRRVSWLKLMKYAYLLIVPGLLACGADADDGSSSTAGAGAGIGSGDGGTGAASGGGGSGGGGHGSGGKGVGGGGMGCTPGSTVPCYDGPAGTEGVGACLAGSAVCGPDGIPEACMGQVLPTYDGCGTAADENCDGATPTCVGNAVYTDMMAGGVFEDSGRVGFLSNGEVVVVGRTTSFNFQPYPGRILDADAPPNTEYGIFMARLTSAGVGLDAKLYGAPGNQSVFDMAIDAQDHIHVLGYSEVDIDFGDGPSGGPSLFVLELDATGALVGTKHIPHATFPSHARLALDPTGGMAVSGTFDGLDMDLDLGQGPLPDQLRTRWLARYDANGQLVFGHSIVLQALQGSRMDIAFTPSGKLLLAGGYSGTLQVGGTPQAGAPTFGGFVVATLNANGTPDVLHAEEADNYATGRIDVAPDGRFWVAGRGMQRIPGDPSTFPPTNILGEGFAVAYSSVGLFELAVELPAIEVRSIAVDPVGDVIIGGEWESGADFGQGPQTPASSDEDLFAAKLDPMGGLRWVNLATSTQDFAKVVDEVAVGPDGTIALTARAVGDVDFGLGPQSNTLNNDIFFGLFAP